MNDAQQAAQIAAVAGTGGAAAAKHTALAAGGGVVLVTAAVMSASMPDKKSDFFLAIISTVISSLAIGSYAIQRFGMLGDIFLAPTETHLYIVLAQIGGIYFISGLPGWTVVRGWFVWSESKKNSGIDVIIGDAKGIFK